MIMIIPNTEGYISEKNTILSFIHYTAGAFREEAPSRNWQFRIIITLRRAQNFGDTGPYKNFDFLV